MLMRLPVFGKLTIAAGAKVTAEKWNGLKGGVIALRANALKIDGTVDALGMGYRGGRWSRDDVVCNDSVQTDQGESIGGRGAATTAANAGGAGGIGPGSVSFNGDIPCSPSSGHGTAGEAGSNYKDRAPGTPGGTYGVADGSRLTMGSGGGGNVTCEIGFAGPALVDDYQSVAGGGIVALYASSIVVSATGSVLADGSTFSRTAPSGGYVLLRANTVDFANGVVNALGPGVTCGGGGANTGGKGRVAIHYKTSLAGTSDPAAFTQQTNDP